MSALSAWLASLLVAVAVATATIKDRRLHCGCFLRDINHRQLGISCGTEQTRDPQSGERNIRCEKETLGWVPSGYQYVPGLPLLYKLYRTSKQYQGAEEQCRHDGGHLATPVNQQQVGAIAGILKENPSVKEAFLGFNDIAVEGKFVTITGGNPSYMPWSPGQPDNSGQTGEDCVTVNPNGELNDNRCDWGFAFVCQRDLKPAPPEGYRYLPRLGFYKQYTTTATYQGAKERCEQDGGHLAVIDSQEEADELVKIYDTSPMKESYVGLTDEASEGNFVSETGKPLENLMFVNWGGGEPNNNAQGGENCVTFHVAGTLNDVNCQRNFAFFCELPLPG